MLTIPLLCSSSFKRAGLTTIEDEPDEFATSKSAFLLRSVSAAPCSPFFVLFPTRPHFTCDFCGKDSPVIYDVGPICVQIDCRAFFKVSQPVPSGVTVAPV